MVRPTPPVELLVCTSCRLGGAASDGERPGALLYRRLRAAMPSGATVSPVECLSNCAQGCTVVLRGPGRWTYVYGRLDPALHLDALREGTEAYAGTADGLVPWRARPDHFRKNCIARIPPQEIPHAQP